MSILNNAEDVGGLLVARLQSRTVANGAETDLGVKVYRGLRKINDDMIPCSVLIEGDDDPNREPVKTEYRVAQRYALLAYVACEAQNPNTAAHAAIRDLKRAVFTTGGRPDPRLGGAVKDVRYLGRDIGPRSDGRAFVLAAIEIEVTYVEDVANP